MKFLSTEGLLKMTPWQIVNVEVNSLMRQLSVVEVEFIFQSLQAFYRHPGGNNPTAPHPKLTTGRHSDLYINCPLVLRHSNLCQIMAYQLVLKFYDAYDCKMPKINWVTGSDSSALFIAANVAIILGAKFHPMQKVKFIGEDGKEDEKQVWEKMIIEPDETVLHIEELAVTSVTSLRVRDGIRAAHDYPINFVPFLPILAYRPKKGAAVEEIDGSKVLPFLFYETFVVDPNQEPCPLCEGGSASLKPKGENWPKFMAAM